MSSNGAPLDQLSESIRLYLDKPSSSIPRLAPRGLDVINLAPGDPYNRAPDRVIEAVNSSLRTESFGYGPAQGEIVLREAIAEKFRRQNALEYSVDEILVGAGSKQVMTSALLATIRSGDEVLIAAPSFSMYPHMVRLAHGEPKLMVASSESGFKITADDVRSGLNKQTRWIILNTPANPTGVVYTRDELIQLSAVIDENPRVLLMSDEIYEDLIFGSTPHTSPATINALRERVLTVGGISKTYGMTGWRVGYAGGPEPLIKAISAVIALTSTCPPGITQAAATAALQTPKAEINTRREMMVRRRDKVMDALSDVPRTTAMRPEAGLYVVINCTRLLKDAANLASDTDLVNWLRNEFGVMVMPGDLFALPGHIRVSFAFDDETLDRGLERLREGLNALAASTREPTGEVTL